MKNPALYFLLLPFAMQTSALSSQMVPNTRPAPQFTLTLSEGRRDGTMVAYQQVLVVKLTNISKEVMHRTVCESFGGMYNLEVVYNGVPIEETDVERDYRKRKEAGSCTGGSAIAEHTKPGEDRYDTLYYNTMKPGTYEFTATKKTLPQDPDRSVTVRSNTITIVVPEPEDAGQK